MGAGYPFPSLMAAVASSGVAPGDIASPGSTMPINATNFQQGSPITPIPFRFGEFPFPGGLAAFRKFHYLYSEIRQARFFGINFIILFNYSQYHFQKYGILTLIEYSYKSITVALKFKTLKRNFY